MNLNKIEINGFKSFVHRTELNFSGGITAVLGPNGCGKTNIVDAIRWVLGEQKTRMLRNTKMENVIFNGTRVRKPLGMAEVHMTLSNEDGSVSTIDQAEIRISRRLYRSGLSEYFINGELARLKDIKNILIDTGLGSHTYSIIEREMVDSVISDKDDDKRFLLEEAAGVMRYRMQREEALRKIKQTESDLTRLADILAELDKELRSLRYQLGKAKRYTRLKEKVDVMESALVKKSLFDLLQKIDSVKEERKHHEGITLSDENEITLLEDRLQEARIEATEKERRLGDLHESRYKISQELQQHEERIAVLTERITVGKNRMVEDGEEIERATRKRSSLEGERKTFDGRVEQQLAELSKNEKELHERDATLKVCSRELAGLKIKLRDKKQLVLDLVREKERVRGTKEHLETRATEILEKINTSARENDGLRKTETKLATLVAEAEKLVIAKKARLAEVRALLDTVSVKSEEVLGSLSTCEEDWTRANIELNRLTEKKEYLIRIKDEHSRAEGGVLAEELRLKGILADHVRVEKKYRRCFEACLSPVLSGILAGSRKDALDALSRIRNAGNGRVQLLYPGDGKDRERAKDIDGTLGYALDHIKGDKVVIRYLEPYLADVLIAEDVDTAIGALRNNTSARIVTLDGVFFDGAGRIIVAGTDDIDMTLLEFEAKLHELNDLIERVASRAERLAERKSELNDSKARLLEEAAALRKGLGEADEEVGRISAEQRGHEIELVKVREKLSALESMTIEHRAVLEAIEEKLAKAGADPRKEPPIDDDDLSTLEQKVVDMEREKEGFAEAAGRLRLEVATITGKMGAAREKLNNIVSLDGELKELVVSREEDAARCAAENTVSEEQIVETRSVIAVLHEQVEGVEKEIEGVKEDYEETRKQCGELETNVKQLKNQSDEKKENLQRCNLELATLETRTTGLIEKARENFNQDLEAYTRDRDRFDPAEWEQLDVEGLDELRTKVEQFGPVNMLALDEYTEKKDRFDFLAKQKQDLDEAKDSLVQAIRRINREARRRLSETFEKVRQNFKSTFLTLFDGGEADLLFVDSDDPLEAKIKIVASPKGKRLHDISSLSGGERALVALALLFAIYLVKPSPFCVFDEVDAPLDDANIGRFVAMLKSFTDRTQFIVITHNKKTMEAADNLYGVTMQEPGVSRMISVHIGEVDKFTDKGAKRHAATMTEPAGDEVPVQT